MRREGKKLKSSFRNEHPDNIIPRYHPLEEWAHYDKCDIDDY